MGAPRRTTLPGIGASVGPWVVDEVISFAEPSLVTAHHRDHPDRRATVEVRRPSNASRARQRQAVEAMGALTHPRLPRLLEAGEDEAGLWIAMVPFTGNTLADRVEAGTVDIHLACSWLLEVATVLEAAHAAGWMLSGLSPHRIVVGAGPTDVHVLGLERAERPAELDPRADVVTWGLIAHGTLSGEPVFPAALRPDAPDDLPPVPPRAVPCDPGSAHPDWLRRLVRKSTHPDPARRLPDLDAAIAVLEASRPSWQRSEVHRLTPFHIPRTELPPLDVRPTYVDAAQLAQVMAMAGPTRVDRALLVLTSAAMGGAVGLAASALIVLYVELSRLS